MAEAVDGLFSHGSADSPKVMYRNTGKGHCPFGDSTDPEGQVIKTNAVGSWWNCSKTSLMPIFLIYILEVVSRMPATVKLGIPIFSLKSILYQFTNERICCPCPVFCCHMWEIMSTTHLKLQCFCFHFEMGGSWTASDWPWIHYVVRGWLCIPPASTFHVPGLQMYIDTPGENMFVLLTIICILIK